MPRYPRLVRPCSRMCAAAGQAIDAGMTTPEPSDFSGGRDADHRAGRVDERAAGEPLVHRRSRPQHLLDRSAPAGRQRAGDDRNDARARRHRVAPRARDRNRQVADARRRLTDRNRRSVQARNAQYGEARGWIPSGQLRIEELAAVIADVQSVFASERPRHGQHDVGSVDEAAGRTAAALYLDDGGSGAFDRVRQRRGHASLRSRWSSCGDRPTRRTAETDHPIG